MGQVITNLDNIVAKAIGPIVTSNVNVIAAQQAVVDAQVLAGVAEDEADAAIAARVATEAAAADVAALKADTIVAKNTAVAAKDVAVAKAAEAEAIRAATQVLKDRSQELRDDALDYLVRMEVRYDEFDDRFLGGYGEDPLVDNDGDQIRDGAMFWNTTERALKVYDSIAGRWKSMSESSGALLAADNLADLLDKNVARTNLGVYSTAVVDTALNGKLSITSNLADLDNAGTARDNLSVYSKGYIDTITGQNYTFDGDKEFTGDVTVQGDLVVNGTTTTVNSVNTEIADNLLTLNAGEIGAGVSLGSSGILIDRGTEVGYEFKFDETDDSFKIGQIGGLQKVATREDTPIDGAYARWDAATSKFETIDIATEAMTLTNKYIDDISNTIGSDHVHYKVINTSGSTIARGTVLTAQGTQPGTDYIQVVPITDPQTQVAIGIAHTQLLNNAIGLALNTGVEAGLNTSAWSVGTILYPNNAGGLTSTKPTTGKYQACAYVMRQHATQGTLLCEFTEPKYIASTTLAGYVQLNNSLTSTSTTQALTAAQGKVLQDSKEPADPAIQSHITAVGNPHGTVAGGIGVTPNGNLSSTDVQSALEELQGSIDSMLVDEEW